MKNRLTFYILFLSISNICYGSGNLKYQDHLNQPRNNVLINNSPEDRLRESYKRMRRVLTIDTFEARTEDFEEQILDPIDMNNIPNQTEYMNEVIDLKLNLNNINSDMIRFFFSKHRKQLSNRLSLAKIDQQIFDEQNPLVNPLNHHGVKGNFGHLALPLNIRGVLNNLVGKIFHIFEDDNHVLPHVRRVGSGMLSNFNLNVPQNLIAGNLTHLNGVITCGHVISANEDERTTGVYFVPNDALDAVTGFPQLLPNGNNLVNSVDLMNYLSTSVNSYQINTYTTKQRFFGGGVALFPNNSVTATNPQYFSNEDIIFGNIQLNGVGQNLRQFNDPNITVNFDTIRNNVPLIFNDGDPYLSIGYPGFYHYDLLPFGGNNQSNLITDRGYSPLMITSSTAHDQLNIDPTLARPFFNNGIVLHEAPTAKGMSGGPNIKISNGGNQIDVFSITAAGSDNSEEGCY